jgi:hypothetical protein
MIVAQTRALNRGFLTLLFAGGDEVNVQKISRKNPPKKPPIK